MSRVVLGCQNVSPYALVINVALDGLLIQSATTPNLAVPQEYVILEALLRIMRCHVIGTLGGENLSLEARSFVAHARHCLYDLLSLVLSSGSKAHRAT